jgi:hypothetical protein
MKNRKFLLIFSAVFLILLVILFFIFFNETDKKINWEENYQKDNKDPHGLFVTHELLKSYNKNTLTLIDQSIHKSLPTTLRNATYVIIGGEFFLSPTDLDTLLKFTLEGNCTFISSKNFPSILMDTLFKSRVGEWNGHYSYLDSAVHLFFEHKDLKTKNEYLYEVPRDSSGKLVFPNYDWQGINGKYFTDTLSEVIHLGSIKSKNADDYVNFIKVPYGKGFFLFHTTPIVFTNYYLKNELGLEYASKVFSHINEGPIYWDEFSKVSTPAYNNSPAASPLKMILSNTSLKYAWYLTLLLAVLYIIFFAKRRQRLIPVLAQNHNSSLEFIKTIGALYYQQNNHRKLVSLKMKLFLNYIREKYNIPTNHIDSEIIRKIAMKSEIPHEQIEALFWEFKVVDRLEIPITSEDLIRIHLALDTFYKNCK